MYENVRKCLELLPVSYHLYRMARRALDDNEKAQLMWFLKSAKRISGFVLYKDCLKCSIADKFLKSYRFGVTNTFPKEDTLGFLSFKSFYTYNMESFEKALNSVLQPFNP